MTWNLLFICLTAGFAIGNGIDIAFIHRDPPPNARIATRESRRIAGIVVIIVAFTSVFLSFYEFVPE